MGGGRRLTLGCSGHGPDADAHRFGLTSRFRAKKEQLEKFRWFPKKLTVLSVQPRAVTRPNILDPSGTFSNKLPPPKTHTWRQQALSNKLIPSRTHTWLQQSFSNKLIPSRTNTWRQQTFSNKPLPSLRHTWRQQRARPTTRVAPPPSSQTPPADSSQKPPANSSLCEARPPHPSPPRRSRAPTCLAFRGHPGGVRGTLDEMGRTCSEPRT